MLTRNRCLTVACSVSLCVAASALIAAPTDLPSTLPGDTHLTATEGPYVLQTTTTVPRGVSMTCDPGTVVHAAPGGELRVYGTLVADGTTFRAGGASPSPDQLWRGIRIIGPGAQRSRLTACTIVHAGHGGAPALAFRRVGGASPVVGSCVVAESGGDGIACRYSAPLLGGNMIEGCVGAAIRLGPGGAPAFGYQPTTFTGNGQDGTVIEWREPPSRSYTLNSSGSPYIIDHFLTVPRGHTLTIARGTALEFRGQRVGVYVDGTLNTDGTSSRPVILRGVGGSIWGGIEFRTTESSRSTLRHTRIARAGGWDKDAALFFRGGISTFPRPLFEECLIRASRGDGLWSDGGGPRLDRCTIRNSRGVAILNSRGGFVDFVGPCTAVGNASDTVVFRADGHALIFPQVWRDGGIPYRVLGTVSTCENGRLTIEAGVTLRMGRGAFLVADQEPIEALGTASAPITISGTRRGAGMWPGIYIMAGGSSSVFRHCRISGAGAGGAATIAAVDAAGGRLTVRHTRLAHGLGTGLYLENSEATVDSCTITRHFQTGITLAGGGHLSVSNTDIIGNQWYGVFNGGRGTVFLTPNNNISGNYQYELVNASANAIPAQRNFWGATTFAAIKRRIWDGRDEPGVGRAQFEPWLSVPPARTGIASTATRLAIASATAAQTGGEGVQVTYVLSNDADVSAEIVNIAGRAVRRLSSGQPAPAGSNVLLWNRRTDAGTAVPAGRYLVRLTAVAADGSRAETMVPILVAAR